MRISVYGSEQLQAVLSGMKNLDREIAKWTRKLVQLDALPIWRESLRGQAQSRQEVRVLSDTARVAVSNQNVTLKSAGVGRSMQGGAKPSEIAHSVEFGADRNYVNPGYTAVSRKGKRYTVKGRHTRKQFRPRNLKGYTVYPAFAKAVPRIASLWVQTVARAVWDAAEGLHK